MKETRRPRREHRRYLNAGSLLGPALAGPGSRRIIPQRQRHASTEAFTTVGTFSRSFGSSGGCSTCGPIDTLPGMARLWGLRPVLLACIVALIASACGSSDDQYRPATEAEAMQTFGDQGGVYREPDQLIQSGGIADLRQIEDYFWCFERITLTANLDATSGWTEHRSGECERVSYNLTEHRPMASFVSQPEQERLEREGKWPSGYSGGR
jgi:hypothetical protein